MPLGDPAVVLGLDGALIGSRPGIITSLHAALRTLGREPDPALVAEPSELASAVMALIGGGQA